MKPSAYGELAEVYDHLFNAEAPFSRARRKTLGPLWKHVHSACDLGCGTGTWALALAARGIRTYGVDLSRGMLRAARAKAAGRVRFIHADMRDFRLPEPVDLVTSEYDAINHVPRRADLLRVFRSVARALKPGGYFVFDLNNRRAFETIWSSTWFLEEDPVSLVMRCEHRPGSWKAAADVVWFVREGPTWRRHHEQVTEVCWTAEEVRAALTQAGFVDPETWDAAPFFKDGFTLPGNRTFWRTRKASQK